MRILTEQEVEQVTGRRQPAAQIRWLQKNRLHHYVNAAGRPVVPESSLERQEVTKRGPNLDAVRRAS